MGRSGPTKSEREDIVKAKVDRFIREIWSEKNGPDKSEITICLDASQGSKYRIFLEDGESVLISKKFLDYCVSEMPEEIEGLKRTVEEKLKQLKRHVANGGIQQI